MLRKIMLMLLDWSPLIFGGLLGVAAVVAIGWLLGF